MNITILTLFPELIKPYFVTSLPGRICSSGVLQVSVVDIRQYASDSYGSCDDAPYGGGAGMLLMPEPLARAMDSIQYKSFRTIFATPSGVQLNQSVALDLSKEENLVFICGRYEGIDERIIQLYVDDEISIGDYVLSSGELATLTIIDSIIRLIDGVINKESLVEESFTGGLLEYPQYTRPAKFRNLDVPEVLLSGNHEMIRLWREEERIKRTRLRRPDLYIKFKKHLK